MDEIPDQVEAEMRGLLHPETEPGLQRGLGIRQAVLTRARRRVILADLVVFALFRVWGALLSLLGAWPQAVRRREVRGVKGTEG